jgi:hypothetical protein
MTHCSTVPTTIVRPYTDDRERQEYNRVHPLLSPLPDSRDIPRHALMDTNNGVLFMETIILVRYDNTFIRPSVKIKIVWLRRTSHRRTVRSSMNAYIGHNDTI